MVSMNLFLWDEFNGGGAHPNYDRKGGSGLLKFFFQFFLYYF